MMSRFRTFLFTLAKLLALPWRLATYQPSPPAGPLRQRQGNLTEEDVELGLYLLR